MPGGGVAFPSASAPTTESGQPPVDGDPVRPASASRVRDAGVTATPDAPTPVPAATALTAHLRVLSSTQQGYVAGIRVVNDGKTDPYSVSFCR